jgi:Skp family chaperone for outer membrane proteins
VKRMILAVAAMAALAVAYCATHLLAQAPGGAAPAVASTRVAVVNVGTVFTTYKKATFFKSEMEETLKPFKAKLDKLQATMASWQGELGKPGSKHTKEEIEGNVVQLKRAMEDEQRQARALASKKSETQLVQLWKEINDVVVRAAKANAFNIVLAFGDPSDHEATGMGAFANINRKLQAIEMGSTSPLYFDGSVNITDIVVQTLNAG